MQNLEIKVWGNPAGFVELTKQLPSIIFTSEEKLAFNPDGYDACKVREFFTIYYTAHSYVVTFHFYAQIRELDFRDKRTLLSVAIPRDYKFPNLLTLYEKLRKEYEKLINEQVSDINQVSEIVSRTILQWELILSEQLQPDPLQPIINLPGRNGALGYVLWANESDLKYYLEAPMRTDFIGASVILLVPNDPTQLESNRAFLNNFQFVRANPLYTPKYSLYFPAIQDTAFAIVSSLDEVVDKVFSTPYFEPITLRGRLRDHITDWKISPTSDRTGYNIGLELKKIIKRYKIDVEFRTMLGTSQKVKDACSWLTPSIGHIEEDNSGIWLVLEGLAIARRNEVNITSNREDYFIQRIERLIDGGMKVYVQEVFYFDVPHLKNLIKYHYDFTPSIKINYQGQWEVKNDREPWYGPKDTIRVKIEESDEYEELQFTMADDIEQLKLKKKKGLELPVILGRELQRWMEDNPKARVVVRQFLKKDDNNYTLEAGKRKKKWEQVIDLDNLVLNLPTSKIKQDYSFEAQGFKRKTITIYPDCTELRLNLKPKLSHKLRPTKVRLLYFIIGLLMGLAIVWAYHSLPLKEKTTSKTEKQNGQETNNSSQNKNTEEFYNGANDTDQTDNIVDEKKQETQEREQQEGRQSVNNNMRFVPQPSEQLVELIAILDGTAFQKSDLDNAKKQADKENLNKQYNQKFEDCQQILNVCEDKKSRSKITFVKNLLDLKTITDQQKNAINLILEYEESYVALTGKYKSLDEIMEELGYDQNYYY